MADNVTIPASGTGTATPVVATDEVAGAHYQRVKLDLGADGATSPVVDALPVTASEAIPITSDWNESDRDAYMRRLLERAVIAVERLIESLNSLNGRNNNYDHRSQGWTS